MADDALPTCEDQAFTVDALATDSDSDGDRITSAIAHPATGTAAVVIENGRTIIVFTPAKDYEGLAVVNYTTSDDHGGTDTAVVKIDVGARHCHGPSLVGPHDSS